MGYKGINCDHLYCVCVIIHKDDNHVHYSSRPESHGLWVSHVKLLHAMLMIFFFIMPGVMSGLGNLLVPIQLCVPELIFPKVNNLGISVGTHYSGMP